MIQSEPQTDPFNDFMDKLLESPKFEQKVNERIDQKVGQRVTEILSEPKIYTEKQMAEMFHKCQASIYRMSTEQLLKCGFVRFKVGYSTMYKRVRFDL